MTHPFSSLSRLRIRPAFLIALSLTLCACGGLETSGAASQTAPDTSVSSTAQSFALTLSDSGAQSPSQAVPVFHAAPIILEVPSDTDAGNPNASAQLPPHLQTVPAELARLSSRRLTRAVMDEALRDGVYDGALADQPDATPLTTGSVVATYTPAQIRAAYSLPALPAVGSAFTSAQASQLGAGQTIYIIDAQNDPNAAAELAAFNQTFGLPTCQLVQIPTNASLPLAPAVPSSGCTFSTVFTSASGTMTSAAPVYNSGWATEIALDVQWSHATAPLARIILIEAPDSSTNSLLAAIALANSMGPGIVSMSFGAPEGSWTASAEAAFTTPGMSYLAAAGDSGVQVLWPAVSPNVVAVGGTTLTYSGVGPRSEVVWSGTGGGVSQYTAVPAYQTSAARGAGVATKRLVSDVAFNADPATGQYVAVIAQGSTSVGWMDVGGTSIATPQWAGILAVANAQRAQSAQPPLGLPHALLYDIAAQAAVYAADFNDIIHGSDGSCVTCFAGIGYDLPSGIGTPNVAGLLTSLVPTTASTSPVVTSANVSGTVGTQLSFTVSVSDRNPVSYSLSNAPSGMTISSSGIVTWSVPVAGNYSVTVKATDSQTGLAGQGVYTITIQAPRAPVVAEASISGTVGVALTYTLSVSDSNPVTLALSGAPSGLTINNTGVVTWASPVAGSYVVSVTAHDTKTGLSGTGSLSIQVATPTPPTIASLAVSGVAGKALSFGVSVTASSPVTLTLSGAPAGMTINSTGVVAWSNPLVGSYRITVSAKDTKSGLTGSGTCTVTIIQAGPIITAAAMVGLVGKALSGAISFSDSSSNMLSVTILGIPPGVTLAVSGTSLKLNWAAPAAGRYSLNVSAKDGNGITATAAVPITITAK